MFKDFYFVWLLICLVGFLDSLKKLLYDIDDFVRIKTTEVLYIMAGHNVGRWAAVFQNY